MPEAPPAPDFSLLVDPRDGEPLRPIDSGLLGSGGRVYPLVDGIADLLDAASLDQAGRDELEVFENIPLEGVCYFRRWLLDGAASAIKTLLNKPKAVCAEIGGGEGHFAAALRDVFPGGTGLVCDLSLKALRKASPRLVRVRCDVRRPFLQPESLDVAAFWVSLHHFPPSDMMQTLVQIRDALSPGGLMVFFEPSQEFFPRRLFLKTRLQNLVYYDEEEKALGYHALARQLMAIGLAEEFCTGVCPPYSLDFLRNFKLWPLFLAATEAFRAVEGLARMGRGPWWAADVLRDGPQPKLLPWGSYFLGIWRKP